MGLLAAKLLVTVCLKTKEKTESPTQRDRMSYIQERVEAAERRLRVLFEQDARDFARVVDLRVVRDRARTRNEASAAARAANDLLQAGTDPIFEIGEVCLTLVDFGISLFTEGWEHVRGDTGAAISAANSGAMSCVFIASLNAKALRKRPFARQALVRCENLTSRIQTRQAAALECVSKLSSEAVESLQLPTG